MATLFTPDWTGTNGDPWPSGDWPTTGEDTDADTHLDIQTNNGRMAVGNVNDEYASAVGPAATNVTDSSVVFRVYPETVSTNNFWLYVCFRSTGDIQAAHAGRPTTSYYFRFDVRQNTDNALLYRRNTNSEAQLVGATGMGHTPANPFWIRAECLAESGDVRLRARTWDDGNSEGGSWTINYLHTDVATKITGAGEFMLVCRNTNSGSSATKEIQVDSLVLSDFTAGGGDTTIIVDMPDRRFRRLAV